MSLWLNRRRILRAVAGELPPAEEQRLRAHVAGCGACRGHYDQVSQAAETLGTATSARRERERVLAAVVAAPAPAASSRVVPVLAVAAAAGLVLWLSSTADKERVGWRGAGDETRAPVRLLLHASRKGDGDAPNGPLRFIADLPGAGEGRVSTRDYLQLSYVGLKAPAYAMVVAIDEAGAEHQYAPRPDAEALRVEPTAKAKGLGPSVYLGRQRPGKFRVFGVFSDAPLEARIIREAANRAAAAGKPAALEGVKAVQVSGVLIVEP
jgi:hypothetical protein